MNKKIKTKAKIKIKKISNGMGYINIYASFNNTILNVSQLDGKVLGQTSAGSFFRGAKKTTIYAAQKAAQNIMSKAQEFGINRILLKVRNIGPGRDAALREIIANNSFQVDQLIDMTGISFSNQKGVRPRKKPRK